MGRMLETLKNGDTNRLASANAPVGECVTDWSLPEPTEVPFIEVGGPRKLDGSPQVLAARHAPQPPVQPPHASTEKGLAAAKPAKVVHMAEARPMSVAFEAWPGTKKLTRAVAGDIIAYHQPEHSISQQYLALLEQMTQSMPEGGVILLSGIRGLVGASTVLLNLAVSAARALKKRTVVWEANLARSGVAARLGLDATAGVAEVLGGAAALEKVVLEAPVPNLYLLPAHGDSLRDSRSACTPEAARWLVAWLRERFDLVLIDGPSLDNGLALSILAPLADDLYLVAPQSEKHLVHPGMAQTVAQMGGRLRGLIHTQFEV